MKARIWILAVVALIAVPLFGQSQRCAKAGITVEECIDSIVTSTLTAVEEKQVAQAATGTPAVDSAAGNALRDFLSLFLAGVENANLSDEGDALTLDYNLRLNDLGKRAIKIQGVLRKPALWEPFATQLESDASRDKLLKTLDDFDDLTVSLAYSPEGTRVGRMLDPHRRLFRAVISAKVGARTPGPMHRQMLEVVREVKRANPDAFRGIADLEGLQFDSITDETARDALRQKTIDFATEVVARRKDFDDRFDAAGLNMFSDLLNNQPQFYVSASARERDALAGPRERSLRATYEMGFVNLNDFKAEAGDACADVASDECVAAFETYTDKPEKQAGADASNRVAFSLEYGDIAGYDITAEGVPDPFHVDGTRKWSGSFAYGRMLVRRDESQHDGRVDFSLTYEDLNSKAEKVDNRWIASAIYTQKLSDTLSLPLGIVWSNHDANVPNSDRRISAHFGLVFKMPTPQ